MRILLALLAIMIAGCSTKPVNGDAARNEGEQLELIKSELERLRTSPALELVPEAQRERVDRQVAFLDVLDSELSAGRTHWAMAQLEGPFVDLAILDFSSSRTLDDGEGAAVLQSEFEELGRQLDRARAVIFSNQLEELPMAYRALIETVWQRAEPTRAAAMAYGDALNFASGVYYLAKADASAKFALFLRTLEGIERAVPSVPSIAGTLAALDREVIEAYDPASAGNYGVYGPHVQLNVAIKEARELDAAGRRYGALYQYLIAQMHFAQLNNPSAPVTADHLNHQLGSWMTRIVDSHLDHGVAVIFLEAAASVLAADEPSEQALQRARIILEHVVPEYFRLLEESLP